MIPAGLHRVVAPALPPAPGPAQAPAPAPTAGAGGPSGDRYSVVQFCHPAPWFVLNPLPACVTPDRPLRYGAIESGALLERVLWNINLIRPES
jgi:hypothetical protein